MLRLFRFASTLALVFLCVGFLKAGDKSPSSSYFPLVKGTTWIYRAGDNRFLIKVADVKTTGDTVRAKLELVVGDKAISFEDVGVTKDGLFRYTFETKEAKPPIKFLQLPYKKDSSWDVNSTVDNQPVKGVFKTSEEDVSVGAGKFPKAVVVTGKDIDANGVKLSITYYFADKVGMVKQVIELAGQKIVIELEEYRPAAEKAKEKEKDKTDK